MPPLSYCGADLALHNWNFVVAGESGRYVNIEPVPRFAFWTDWQPEPSRGSIQES